MSAQPAAALPKERSLTPAGPVDPLPARITGLSQEDAAIARAVLERAGLRVVDGGEAPATVVVAPLSYFDEQRLAGLRASATATVAVLPDGSTDWIDRALAVEVDAMVPHPIDGARLHGAVGAVRRARARIADYVRRFKDAELLVDLTQALASSLDLREILYTLVVRTAEVVRVDRVSIVLVREGEDRGFVVVTSDDQQLRDLPIELERYPEIRRAIADRAPVVIEDSSSHPVLASLRAAAGARSDRPVPFASLAIVPLLFEDRPMGVLYLRAREATTFDDRALSLCRTLASATAVGLRNARILQSLRDQTEQITFARFEAERRMRAMQRYADFFESIGDGVAVLDHNGYLLFANPRAKELTGFTEADLAGVKMRDLAAPEHHALAIQLGEGLKTKQYPRGVDLRMRRKDGQLRTFSLTFSSVMHEDGATLVTLRDVTQERQDARELAETKDFLEHLIDSSPDAIVSADMKGQIVLFNRAAERVYGRPAAEVIGTSVERLYPQGVARQIMALIRSDAYGGKGRLEGYRTDFVAAGGEIVPISMSAALIKRGDQAIGSVGIFTDLRERIRIEQRLAHAQEQLRIQEKQTIVAELAGAAAHELNQPLTSVMGYAELLRRRLEAGTPQHHAADIIVTEAERMAEIVRKIGKITRYETKSYVGSARILDLDRAAVPDSREPQSDRAATSSPPTAPSSGPRVGGNPGAESSGADAAAPPASSNQPKPSERESSR